MHPSEPTCRGCLLDSRGALGALRGEATGTPLLRGDVAAPDAARGRGNGAWRLRGGLAGGEQVSWGKSRADGCAEAGRGLGRLPEHEETDRRTAVVGDLFGKKF